MPVKNYPICRSVYLTKKQDDDLELAKTKIDERTGIKNAVASITRGFIVDGTKKALRKN